MKIEKIICMLLCAAILFCCVSCKKSPSLLDVSSETSVITEIVYSEIETTTNSEDTSFESEVSSYEEIVSEDVSSEESEPPPYILYDESLSVFERFGFNELKSVEYFCVKNVPNTNSIYAVKKLVTDTGKNILNGCELVCDNPAIKIDKMTITIPYDYTKNNNSLTLSIRHIITKLTLQFTINFKTEWKMIFEDEFEGTELDTTKWDYRPDWLRNKGYVNYWDRSTMFVDDKGNLVSRATPGKKTVWDKTTQSYKEIDAYLSGAISTKGLFESTYGYYEARVKLHHQTGMWGAFWLICGDMDTDAVSDDSSVNGCEIDVFESLYNHGGVAQNIHWDGFRGNTVSLKNNGYVTNIDTYDNQYHTFALSWTPDEYVFLVDDIVTRRTTAAGICNQPGYMIISTECGTWADKWVLNEGEYSDMLVDYVRVYQIDTGIN